MIRSCVVGFDVFDDKDNLIAHVLSFVEASAIYNKTKPKQSRRRKVGLTRVRARTRLVQRATRDDRKRVSKALGVVPAEVGKFNKQLDEYGVTDARYNKKTGYLESTNDDHHAAAWAVRGYYDQEATNGTAMRLADRMGF